jgi:two-component system cell cycle response regulator
VGARILVIEDNPANLELMRYLLAAFGHTVSLASNGEDGFRAIVRERPDLVICDLQLPDIDGFEIARRARATHAMKDVPLVAVTAFAMVGDRDRVLASGFDGYIPKPIEPQSFVTQIDAFLSRREKSQAPEPFAATPEPPATPRPRQASGRRVLVVDDVAANRYLLTTILEAGGYEVAAVASVAEACAASRSEAPDIILSDFHLSGESGLDLVKWVRAHPGLERTPFLFISSTVRAEPDRRAGLDHGADRFLSRPIDAASLLQQLSECLNSRMGA